MGQAAKYAVLGAAIAVCLGLIVALIGEIFPESFFGDFNTAVGGALSTLAGYFRSVRGAINCVLGTTGAINAYSLIIKIDLLFSVILIPVEVAVTVFRFINQ